MKYKVYLITILTIIFWIAFFQSSHAATYYVDASNGNDTYPGNEAQPWKTVQRAEKGKFGVIPSVVGGDTIYIAPGNYGFWKWNKVYNDASGLWTTYAAKDAQNPPIFRQLHITSSSDIGVVDQVVRDGYLIFDGIRIVMTEPTQPELNSPWAFASHYLSHIKLKKSYIEAGRHWRISDHTIRGTCIWIRGSAAQANDIEVSDCELYGSNDGLVPYMVNNSLFTRNKIHNMSNDCMSAANISNIIISDSQFYDAQSILGDKYLTDDNNTVSGAFTVGETLTQTNPTYGTVVATLKAIYPDGYYFMDIANKGAKNGGFIAGYQIIGQTSNATLTPSTVSDSYHSDLFQLWYSPSTGGPFGANVTVQRNVFHDGYQGFFVEGHNAISNLIVENNLWYGSFIVHAFTIHDSAISATVRNNTICQTGKTADFNLYGNQPTAVFNVHNNIFSRMWNVPNGFGQTLNESHNIAAQFLFGNQVPARDPTDYSYGKDYTTLNLEERAALFMDPVNNDFRLKTGSRAINFGSVTQAPLTDILGNPRDSHPDAGAYEYQGATLPPTIIYGDINGDGAVSSADALLAVQHSLGLTTLTSDQITKGDVSSTGGVTSYDAALILQKIAGIISKFPVE